MKRPQIGLRMIFLIVGLLGAFLGWSLAIRDGLAKHQQRLADRRNVLKKNLGEWDHLRRSEKWMGTDTGVADDWISKLTAELKATE